MLLLQGAMAAAKLGDATTATDLLDAADEAAQQLGGDHNHYWSCFGPTNVLLHRIAAAVELGDAPRALEMNKRIRPDGLAALVPERRVHYLLDMARGWAQVGRSTAPPSCWWPEIGWPDRDQNSPDRPGDPRGRAAAQSRETAGRGE